FLKVLKNIRDLLASLGANCPSGQAFCVDIGSFDLVKDKALTTDANPATAQSLIAHPPGALDAVDPLAELADHMSEAGKTLLLDSRGGRAPPGDPPALSFPALHEPQQLFGLLLGQDVELAHFDSGPLTLGFEFQKSFGPVYAPPPVNVVI